MRLAAVARWDQATLREGRAGLFCIDDQVEKDLLNLRAIGKHPRQAGVQVGLGADVLHAQFVGAQCQCAFHDFIQVYRSFFGLVFAGKQ
jgi:hypothetical protein